jgi:hypothetical protein
MLMIITLLLVNQRKYHNTTNTVKRNPQIKKTKGIKSILSNKKLALKIISDKIAQEKINHARIEIIPKSQRIKIKEVLCLIMIVNHQELSYLWKILLQANQTIKKESESDLLNSGKKNLN